ncbi:MAG TPA: leucyl aminopeptidase family protein [Planctomycetes bacterium]|nr:leucyl aminopeptidase family protein [Planctomycetota bacterium]HIL37797.1 leucyl aminopeptidase family protein [Planctomycetota bacterium]
MTTLRYPRTIDSLLRGTDHLLVVGSEATLKAKRNAGLSALPKEIRACCKDLASDLSAGRRGNAAGSLCAGSVRKVAIGMLPDRVSRHNSPSRAEAVRSVMARSNTGKKGKGAVLLLLDDPAHQEAATLALARNLHLFNGRSGAKKKSPSLGILAIDRKGKVLTTSRYLQQAVVSLRDAARMVDTPPTELDPAGFQKDAWRLVRGMPGVTKRAIIGDKLLEAGLGGIHGVGRCALSPPRLLILSYKPRNAKGHVALVGKGVTYDTGGLSLKVGGGMVGMKGDMGGAAAVLGAFRTLASSGIKKRVSALLCMAENAIGPDAFKNDDILDLHSGLRVEINNTDAEGRLVLADGVSYAARILKADTIIDAATLTGAQLVATGRLHAGLVSDDEDLENILVQAGRHTGELVHPLPYAPEFHRKEFVSTVADMRNSVKDRMNAQSSCAGEFIRWQLDGTKARWAHVDLAGPAMIAGRGSGFGAALLAEAVRGL